MKLYGIYEQVVGVPASSLSQLRVPWSENVEDPWFLTWPLLVPAGGDPPDFTGRAVLCHGPGVHAFRLHNDGTGASIQCEAHLL